MSKSDDMEHMELDMAIPTSFDKINEYYRDNLKNILKSSSSETVSSITSTERKKKMSVNDYDDSSSIASDSDFEDCTNCKKSNDQVIVNVNENCSSALSNDGISATTTVCDNLQNKLQNINSVSINHSSDVHFGNKTFFNGPVTIKQIVIKDEYLRKKDDSNGVLNSGFEGSSTQINTNHITNDKSDDIKQENTVQNSNDCESNKKIVIAQKKIMLALVLTVCALAAALSLLFIVLPYNEDEEPPHIITRDKWQAKTPKEALTKLELPVKRIIIAHTVTDECFTEEDCAQIVRDIQNMHLYNYQFNFSDIAYNFIIGGDGSIFEGRGWRDQGAHTSGYNRGSIGVAYIGTFIDKVPSNMQLNAGFRLFHEGVRVGALTSDYVIFGASQLRTTQSPGDAFFELIKKWKHFSETIVS
ncbi:hypothetical protein PVAND_005770 [Polypedilum vanderplanki]|uniref:Peptidoglycan recognition protein n=1 Tax=Polypedilum vanderplanki TaxID=319348 RepID=A0A9J6C1I6_POLVA|nr:hypothetical protein PVAND_005770 [Polypedilum vanderplanki]